MALPKSIDAWQHAALDLVTRVLPDGDAHSSADAALAAAQLANDAGIPADFRLLAELGEGAQGRVYLARQPALADRPVVLKITACQGQEYLSLARLQHTHIVPLYGVHDDPRLDRRTLCMPYFGNLTLEGLLQALRKGKGGARTGRDILTVLDARRGESPVALPAQGPARPLLERASYVQAICWMTACLADALQYAHERGLIHLDVKPSNILLASDGQPMLLDFHLARAPIRIDGPMPRGLGGTRAYMSPEQRAAMSALSEGKMPPEPVDGRSDLYSLGLVLYESLGGGLLTPGATPRRLDRVNAEVSRGLADIVQKCLACDPKGRYPDAATVAADLRRHLNDLPLHGVANRSLAERWRKWRRRQPHSLLVYLLVGMLLLGLAGGGLGYLAQERQRLHDAEAALQKGQAHLDKDNLSAAIEHFEQGLRLVERCQGGNSLAETMAIRLAEARARLHQVQRRKAGADFHALVNQVRLYASSEGLSPAALDQLDSRCRALWDARQRLLDGRDDEKLSDTVWADLRELVCLWVGLRVRLVAQSSNPKGLREGLSVLDEVEKACGTSPVLHHHRRLLWQALGDGAEAQARHSFGEKSVPSAGEHVILARLLLVEGRFEDAGVELERALALAPRDFWANFTKGICDFRRGRHADAVLAFHGCIMLSRDAPETAHCHVNRALALAALGQSQRALLDYDQALRLDPTLAAAWFNRGLLQVQLQNYAKALSDLQTALRNGSDAAATHFQCAQIHLAQQNAVAARSHLRRTLGFNPNHAEAAKQLHQLGE